MHFNIFYSITIISVVLSFIMAIYFLFTREGNKLSNALFSVLLLVFICLISHSFMVSIWAYQYFTEYSRLVYFLYLFGFLTGPISYVYIKSTIHSNFRLNYRHILHIFPFIVLVVIAYLSFKIFYLQTFGKFPLMFITAVLLLIHNAIYSTIIIIKLKNNSSHELFTESRHHEIYRWSQLLILVYVILWFLAVNAFFVPQFIVKPKWCSYTASIYLLFFFVFIMIVVFIALFKPDFILIKSKYNSSSLTNKEKEDYYNRITSYIATQKAYKDPDISLNTVSEKLNILSRYISNVINEFHKQHFNDYINLLRIEECKLMLSEKSCSKMTVSEIFYEVGFNSKSAFNRAFKKHVGITPTEYRKKYLDK